MSKRILIIKPSSLGDIVHALPTLSALRRRFPHSWMGWVVKREWADILQGHPELNEVVPVDLHWSRWPRLVSCLRDLGCDMAIDLQGLFRTGLLAWLSGARERVGFAAGREGSPMFYTQRVELPNPEKQSWRLLDMHAVDRNLRIAQHLDADISRPRFVLPDFSAEEKEVAQWWRDMGVKPGERVIGVAPLSRSTMKNWPIDRFLDVAAALHRNVSCRIVLLGTAAQQWMAGPFHEKLGAGVIDLTGKTGLRHLPPILMRLGLLLANDSAILHLATAVNIPVLALFGPTNPAATGPYGPQRGNVMTVSLPCRPCGQRTCRHSEYLSCLSGLSVENVLARAMDLLRQSSTPSGNVE